MIPILVSACLLGERVRYDGSACPIHSPHLERWRREDRLIAVCPEVLGGLPVPRSPAELLPDGRVLDGSGADVTEAFRRGAEAVLAMCQTEWPGSPRTSRGGQDLAPDGSRQIPLAILKEGSPSCGSARIHDGSFNGTKIPGQGITTRLLRARGVMVFSETQIDEAAAFLADLEERGWPRSGEAFRLEP